MRHPNPEYAQAINDQDASIRKADDGLVPIGDLRTMVAILERRMDGHMGGYLPTYDEKDPCHAAYMAGWKMANSLAHRSLKVVIHDSHGFTVGGDVTGRLRRETVEEARHMALDLTSTEEQREAWRQESINSLLLPPMYLDEPENA